MNIIVDPLTGKRVRSGFPAVAFPLPEIQLCLLRPFRRLPPRPVLPIHDPIYAVNCLLFIELDRSATISLDGYTPKLAGSKHDYDF